MRLLLDECVPKRLKRELLGHEVQTVQDMGWAGIKNGALLKLADGQFDSLLTVDQGIEYQQNLSGLTISVVVMQVASNDVDDLRPLLPGVEGAGELADWRNDASGWLTFKWSRRARRSVRSCRCGARLI